jgi:2-haloacid dehalogenase
MSKPISAEDAQHFSRMDRWATFDCYGTLIDWNGGIRRELVRIFGEDRADEQLERYHEVEPTLQVGGQRTYREVMAATLSALGAPAGDENALALALPSWEPFPEVRPALEDARARGWKLAILSNTDRDFIEASMERIGVPFELAIVASEIGSYKPAHRHWESFVEQVDDVPRDRHVHVAQSYVHDIVPATELGLRSVWINRYGERRDPPPTRELPDLTRLPETLDELVAA